MIITEVYKDNLTHTYSSAGNYIERDGVCYAEAIDPAEFGRVYTETEIPVDTGLSETEEKAKAYDILMGVTE